MSLNYIFLSLKRLGLCDIYFQNRCLNYKKKSLKLLKITKAHVVENTRKVMTNESNILIEFYYGKMSRSFKFWMFETKVLLHMIKFWFMTFASCE